MQVQVQVGHHYEDVVEIGVGYCWQVQQLATRTDRDRPQSPPSAGSRAAARPVIGSPARSSCRRAGPKAPLEALALSNLRWLLGEVPDPLHGHLRAVPGVLAEIDLAIGPAAQLLDRREVRGQLDALALLTRPLCVAHGGASDPQGIPRRPQDTYDRGMASERWDGGFASGGVGASLVCSSTPEHTASGAHLVRGKWIMSCRTSLRAQWSDAMESWWSWNSLPECFGRKTTAVAWPTAPHRASAVDKNAHIGHRTRMQGGLEHATNHERRGGQKKT